MDYQSKKDVNVAAEQAKMPNLLKKEPKKLKKEERKQVPTLGTA